jgi:hypothetical protein
MTCRVCEELINAYLDGGPADELEAHARACPECAARRAEADRLLAALAALPPVEPPSDLAARVTATALTDLRRQRRDRLRRWAAPLALAAAAAVLLAIIPRLWKTEPPAPAPAPEAVALRDSVSRAGQAVASLTARTAEETARLLPPMEVPVIETPMGPASGPPLEPIREAGESVASRLQPLTDPARRAVNLFFRDLPVDVR